MILSILKLRLLFEAPEITSFGDLAIGKIDIKDGYIYF